MSLTDRRPGLKLRVATLHCNLPLALYLCRWHVHGPDALIRVRKDRSTGELWSENTRRMRPSTVSPNDRRQGLHMRVAILHCNLHQPFSYAGGMSTVPMHPTVLENLKTAPLLSYAQNSLAESLPSVCDRLEILLEDEGRHIAPQPATCSVAMQPARSCRTNPCST